jgi:hypothetical protein
MSRDPSGMFKHLEKKIAAAENARALEKELWSGAKWIKREVDAGKVEATYADVSGRLVRAAVATGLADEDRATRQVFRGWKPEARERPATTKPDAQHPAPPREAVTPTGSRTVRHRRTAGVLALLRDPLIRNAIAELFFDAASAAPARHSLGRGDAA